MQRRDLNRLALVWALSAWARAGPAHASGRRPAGPAWQSNPFALGVASGQPRPDSVVLWTRLVFAPADLALQEKAHTVLCEVFADEAMRHHDGLDMPFERARTQLLLGQVQRRRRTRTAAAEVLTAALSTFESLGSPLWADRARAELARTNLVMGDGQALSETERRTAELAAAGRSNREISAELFVSVKTVEMNLTRVYRKLGVRSRSQLAPALTQAGPD